MDKKGYREIREEIKEICTAGCSKFAISHTPPICEQTPGILSDDTSPLQPNYEEECNDSSSVDSCSDNEYMSDKIEELESNNIAYDLSHWSVQYNVSNDCANSLLRILQKYHPSIPKDIRTLKRTPIYKTDIVPLGSGLYTHFGLKNQIENFLNKNVYPENTISIDIGIDGIPLTRSSQSQLWPILGNIPPFKEIFIIGIYHGQRKPYNADVFIHDFVEEVKSLQENGLIKNNRKYNIHLRAFICDSPARSFILGTKSHTGYNSCTKCTIKGEYIQHKVCFIGRDYLPRTDDSFSKRTSKEHHVRMHIALDNIKIGCVSQFPIDYMHCVLLGATRQILNCLRKIRKQKFSLKKCAIDAINKNLKTLRKCMPREFVRKQRTLDEMEHWKAVEFRMFLLYTGLVALKGNLDKCYYEHFLLLVCAIRILNHPKDCFNNNECASELIKEFVDRFPELYGQENVSYNIHSLLHLPDDVKMYGHLDGYSAFKFENHLQIVKKMVKKGSFPLQQIVNRLKEKERFDQKAENIYETMALSETYPDNYCTIEGNIMKIENISNNIFKVRKVENLTNLFEWPIASSSLGIFCGNKEEALSLHYLYDVKNITSKVVKLNDLTTSIYLPLIHT